MRKWLAGYAADIATDAVALAGAALISYGAGQVYPPSAWIVGGMLLIAGALLSSR